MMNEQWPEYLELYHGRQDNEAEIARLRQTVANLRADLAHYDRLAHDRAEQNAYLRDAFRTLAERAESQAHKIADLMGQLERRV
jgi:signal transduction protein with GAF and PtsI domain